jgi:hypothetical protein
MIRAVELDSTKEVAGTLVGQDPGHGVSPPPCWVTVLRHQGGSNGSSQCFTAPTAAVAAILVPNAVQIAATFPVGGSSFEESSGVSPSSSLRSCLPNAHHLPKEVRYRLAQPSRVGMGQPVVGVVPFRCKTRSYGTARVAHGARRLDPLLHRVTSDHSVSHMNP